MNKLNKKLQGNKNAFTIIEVVLVLAIAGLIFLIVFLALPGLQRSRRDTQRKSDLNSMAASLESYASNNGGKYPAASGITAGQGIDTLLSNFTPTVDPQGNNYLVYKATPPTPVASSSVNSQILYFEGGICSSGVAIAGSGSYKYAISMKLEGGAYCKDGGQTAS